MLRPSSVSALMLAFALTVAPSAAGQGSPVLHGLEPLVLPAVDDQQILLADEQRVAAGHVPHYAVPIEVAIDPFGDDGTWDVSPAGTEKKIADRSGEKARWRLRLVSAGALSLNLAFTRFRMPSGGSLELISVRDGRRVGPWTALDNEKHGQLWTPPIPTDDLVLELRLPIDEVDDLELELTRVHHGYAGFGETGRLSGSCHRDVACSEAEPWADQSRSVALLSIDGKSFCTGFLVNNTALDGKPFLITAGHCGVTPRNAPSVVALWNYQSRDCGDGSVNEDASDNKTARLSSRLDPIAPRGREDFQTGATWRASHRATDTLLIELDDPPAPSSVYFAGWDRSPANPARSTVIHHPNADRKRISFDFDRATTTEHLESAPQPPQENLGTHLRVASWDMGSTEGGSSGAPLFNEDGRVVGMLQGGYAACGDARADWFGRLSVAWQGDGPRARLSDWLDPLATGAMTLDGIDGSSIEAAAQ